MADKDKKFGGAPFGTQTARLAPAGVSSQCTDQYTCMHETSTHIILHNYALCVVFVPLHEQVRRVGSAPSEQDARHLHAGPLLQEGHLRTGRLATDAGTCRCTGVQYVIVYPLTGCGWSIQCTRVHV